MPSYLVLAVFGLIVAYTVSAIRSLRSNIHAAKQSGLPYVPMPVWTFNRFWLVTHTLWLPFIKLLPQAWTRSWLP